MEPIELQLSLLRGASPNPIAVDRTRAAQGVQMHLQRRNSLSDRLSVNVMGLIAGGRLGPGMRLPPERRIAEAAAISRVCVRAALDRLKQRGYLEAVQGAGTRVTPSAPALEELRAANRANLAQLADFGTFLDGLLIGLAVERAVPEAVAAALAATPAPGGRASDRPFLVRRRLADLSRSGVLRLLVERLERGLRGYHDAVALMPMDAARRQGLDRLRQDLAAAVAAGDAPAAQQAMAEQGRLGGERLLAGLERASAALRPAPDAEVLRDLAPLPPVPLSQIVMREIAGMIAAGHFAGGERLCSERQFADLFGVSRPTVQEALARLRDLGLLPPGDRRPAAEPAPGGEGEVTPADLHDLNRLRQHLEPRSAWHAARGCGPADAGLLRRILTEMGRPIDDAGRAIQLDLKLHMAIARIGGSAINLYVSEALRLAITRYFHLLLGAAADGGGPAEASLGQHEAIVARIVAADPAGARAAMADHVRSFRHRIDGIAA